MRFPIHIELHRSFILSTLLVAIHLLAIFAIGVSLFAWPLKASCFALVLLSFFFYLRPSKIEAIHLFSKDRVELFFKSKEIEPVIVLEESHAFRFFLLLSLQLEGSGKIIRLPLFPDQMDKDVFRNLSIWIRWAAKTQEG